MLSIHYKSQTQPDGGGPEQSRGASRKARATKGSGNGVAVWQLGGSIPGEKAALSRQSTANARGDEQKSSQAGLVGRVRNTG